MVFKVTQVMLQGSLNTLFNGSHCHEGRSSSLFEPSILQRCQSGNGDSEISNSRLEKGYNQLL